MGIKILELAVVVFNGGIFLRNIFLNPRNILQWLGFTGMVAAFYLLLMGIV